MNLVEQAWHAALDAKIQGYKTIMVVFPTRKGCPPQGASPFNEGSVFTRYSDEHTSLLSVPHDCLIFVDTNSKAFDYTKMAFMVDRLKNHHNSCVRHIN